MTNSQALTVHEGGDLALVGVDVEAALAEWQAYQRLTRELLDDSDYQKIGKTRFKKKSAWRKYGKAFNLSTAITYEEIVRDPTDAHPIWARVRVMATAPNGRHEECDQEAHVLERCCPARIGKKCGKASWKTHYCCVNGCDGRVHWSHPGDLPATATTRAKNRAIADLIGAGEVSAEEMALGDEEPPERGRKQEPMEGEYREAPSMGAEAPSKHQVAPPAPKGGWEQFDEARVKEGISVEEVESYTEVRFKKVDVAAWLRERGMTYSGLLSALINARLAAGTMTNEEPA